MNKVLAFLESVIVWPPVATDGKDFSRALLYRHHVRQRQAGGFSCFLVNMLKAFQVQVDVHLKQLVPVIRCSSEAQFLSDGLLNLIHRIDWRTQVNVTVEASQLEAAHLVLGFAHHMGNAITRL